MFRRTAEFRTATLCTDVRSIVPRAGASRFGKRADRDVRSTRPVTGTAHARSSPVPSGKERSPASSVPRSIARRDRVAKLCAERARPVPAGRREPRSARVLEFR